jgi:hypothetical protein
MSKKMFFMTRLYFAAIVTIAIWSLLSWNHYHGGVPSHHILARKDLPEISNWWGGLLLPLLTLFLFYRMENRVTGKNDDAPQGILFPRSIIYGFIGALFFGITLSAFFTFGNTAIPGYMLMGLLLLSLFLPIYRAECLLGYVIGMTYTFGAVLPTGVGSILAIIGAVLYLVVRPMLAFIISKLSHIASSK